jgi:hypothetical protein
MLLQAAAQRIFLPPAPLFLGPLHALAYLSAADVAITPAIRNTRVASFGSNTDSFSSGLGHFAPDGAVSTSSHMDRTNVPEPPCEAEPENVSRYSLYFNFVAVALIQDSNLNVAMVVRGYAPPPGAWRQHQDHP